MNSSPAQSKNSEQKEKRKVLVFGSSGNIGRAFADLCLENNVEVIELTRKDGFDFNDPGKIESQMDELVASSLTFDAIVNCVGYTPDSPLLLAELEDFTMTLNCNLLTPLLLSKKANHWFSRMNKTGALVQIGSLADEGAWGNAFYSLSKGALKGSLVHTNEFKGVSQSILRLGYFPSALTQNLPKETMLQLERQCHLNRAGKSSEAANMLLQMALVRPAFFHGKEISVSGGLMEVPC
jgi:NAD(P)-dependent dehydrogenase (short-subunit alcohol dehydrogenase family)